MAQLVLGEQEGKEQEQQEEWGQEQPQMQQEEKVEQGAGLNNELEQESATFRKQQQQGVVSGQGRCVLGN